MLYHYVTLCMFALQINLVEFSIDKYKKAAS
jgi:hypothetical protein